MMMILVAVHFRGTGAWTELVATILDIQLNDAFPAILPCGGVDHKADRNLHYLWNKELCSEKYVEALFGILLSE